MHTRPIGGHVANMESLPNFAPINATVNGHNLTVLVSGADRLAMLLDQINSAKRTLRLFFYIFAGDAVGVSVRDTLIAAADRGVKVTLMIDGFGSSGLPTNFFDSLTAKGATFCRFVPRMGRRYLLRNHQKIVIADKTHAVIGGTNIAETYFADDLQGNSWHDLFLLVEGPMVARLARYYDLLAAWTKGDTGGFRGLVRLLQRRSDTKGNLRWLFNGPFRRLSPLTRSLRRDLDAAKQVDMIQAYFAPNWGMLRKLSKVARRGGILRLITAARSDNRMTIAAARHCYRRLLRSGAEVAEYRPQMLHMKLIIIDNIVYIGSANFDMRSLFVNAEVMLRIEDAGFAEKMRAFTGQHMPHCQVITKARLKANSTWWWRFRCRMSYYMVSTLDFTVTRRLSLWND